jgi:hypothetical protein
LNPDLLVLHERKRNRHIAGWHTDDHHRAAFQRHPDGLIHRRLHRNTVEHDIGTLRELGADGRNDVLAAGVDDRIGAVPQCPLTFALE